MRLVGSGLGSSLGSGCSFPSSHTRLPSLRKGKERVREELGERSGVPEGDVSLGSAMSEATLRRTHFVLLPGECGGVRWAGGDMEVDCVTSRLSGGGGWLREERGERREELQGGVGIMVG